LLDQSPNCSLEIIGIQDIETVTIKIEAKVANLNEVSLFMILKIFLYLSLKTILERKINKLKKIEKYM
tara:strand:- start:421 stop:624 length:204 start_codon:yes stop_codon:yes gene_type:complete